MGLTPVAGTATAPGLAADADQPASKRRRAPDPPPAGLRALLPELRDKSVHEHGLAPRDVVRLDRRLHSPAGIAALPLHFQAEPRGAIAQQLGELARQVRHLPDPDRPARFSDLLDRAQALGSPEGGSALTHLATHVTELPPETRPEAFRGVVDRLELLPVDHTARTIASLTLSRLIPRLPPESRDAATRRIVEVLRPLPPTQHEFLLSRPDNQLSPAIKDALRQALAEDSAASLSRAGTSARA